MTKTRHHTADKARCPWCGSDPLYVKYHDEVWGVPERDSQQLFAKLILDGAQAGLSWITILRKQDNYFEAFDGLNPEMMAHYSSKKMNKLLQNPGIVRNRLKIQSAVTNAQAYVRLKQEGVDFSDYLWSFVDDLPIVNNHKDLSTIPTSSVQSDMMSKQLKRDGFKFVGTTICYAFMQAVGMVNDHLNSCFRHREVQELM